MTLKRKCCTTPERLKIIINAVTVYCETLTGLKKNYVCHKVARSQLAFQLLMNGTC